MSTVDFSVFLVEMFNSSSCKEQASEEHERKAGILSATNSLHPQNNISGPGKRRQALKIVQLDLKASGL